MRFLCDEMLGELARWLRAAGYDTGLAGNGASDAGLLARAAAENRILLTRDRHLCGHAGSVRALCLSETGLDAVARELTRSLGVDWQYAPFTRCLVDNTALRTATAGEAAGVPERSRAAGGRVTRCPSCGRLYWEGGHHRRMRAMLARFATGGE